MSGPDCSTPSPWSTPGLAVLSFYYPRRRCS